MTLTREEFNEHTFDDQVNDSDNGSANLSAMHFAGETAVAG